jgi:hypothetical protein
VGTGNISGDWPSRRSLEGGALTATTRQEAMRKGNKAAIALIQRKGGLTTTDPKMLDFFQVPAEQACDMRNNRNGSGE